MDQNQIFWQIILLILNFPCSNATNSVTISKKIVNSLKLSCGFVNCSEKNIWQPCTFESLSYKIIRFFYAPSSGIASSVMIAGTVTWCLHLKRPCYIALGQILIWVVCLDWFEEHITVHGVYSGSIIPF